MGDRCHFDSLRTQPVHDPVVADYAFTDIRSPELRNDPADLRKVGSLFNGGNDSLGEVGGVSLGVG